MIRQRQRKTIEELYGNKFDTIKSQVTGNTTQKNIRGPEKDYGYIITTNTPYSGPIAAPPVINAPVVKPLNTARESTRRKSARPSNKLVTDKHLNKEKDSYGMEDIKQEHNTKLKTSRLSDKSHYCAPPVPTPNVYDNKLYNNFKDIPMEGNPKYQQHHHHRQTVNHDEDKDDDTDEFFELIRHTVENAIGKSISELLNRNFRELSSKIERFSAELNNTNALLNQIQIDMNNKIVHYGEENSRHFRYLCMKSEYDKMFYQHQTMVASATAPTNTETVINSASTGNIDLKKPEHRKSGSKININSTNNVKSQRSNVTNDVNKPANSGNCTCRGSANCKSGSSTEDKTAPRKKSSEDISQKSSESGMREVLEHIQKFYNQMQMNDAGQAGGGAGPSPKRNVFRNEEFCKINKEIFNEDDDEDDVDDELDFSSDGMTPRCDDNYGGTTKRGCMTSRGASGGGDA